MDCIDDYHHCSFLFIYFFNAPRFSTLQRTQAQYSFPNADLPRYFTDATRAVLVDWLIQVHVSKEISSTLKRSLSKYPVNLDSTLKSDQDLSQPEKIVVSYVTFTSVPSGDHAFPG